MGSLSIFFFFSLVSGVSVYLIVRSMYLSLALCLCASLPPPSLVAPAHRGERCGPPSTLAEIQSSEIWPCLLRSLFVSFLLVANYLSSKIRRLKSTWEGVEEDTPDMDQRCQP